MSVVTARTRLSQLARFCVVGLTCYVFNIVALAALCELLGMHYAVAFTLVFLAGNVLGYWLNKRFTFGIGTALDRAALVRYLAVNLLLLAVGVGALHALVEWMGLWYLAATTIVAAILAPLSFVAHRLVTYRLAD
jgi:putative flippase GtrA